MPIYRGVGGTNRKIKTIYRGVNGTNKLVKEVYRGVGGTNRKVFGLEGSWIADNSKNGNLGELQLNVPCSNSKPTIIKVGDSQTVDTTGALQAFICCNSIFLNASDSIQIDWEYERDTRTAAWMEFYVGNYAVSYNYSNYAFSRKTDTFTGATGVFIIRMRRSNTPYTNVWGKLTIYNVWLNGLKVL